MISDGRRADATRTTDSKQTTRGPGRETASEPRANETSSRHRLSSCTRRRICRHDRIQETPPAHCGLNRATIRSLFAKGKRHSVSRQASRVACTTAVHREHRRLRQGHRLNSSGTNRAVSANRFAETSPDYSANDSRQNPATNAPPFGPAIDVDALDSREKRRHLRRRLAAPLRSL